MTESYTGLYIYIEFINILNEYLSLKLPLVLSITRDNASNNNIFINTYKKNFYSLFNKHFVNDIRCVAYIINLVA